MGVVLFVLVLGLFIREAFVSGCFLCFVHLSVVFFVILFSLFFFGMIVSLLPFSFSVIRLVSCLLFGVCFIVFAFLIAVFWVCCLPVLVCFGLFLSLLSNACFVSLACS